MKRCSKCGVPQALDQYYKAKGARDGLRGECKKCFAVRGRIWYQQNREHAIASVKRWQQENAERLNAYRRVYRAGRTVESREGHLRRTFGLSLADYERMLHEQHGGCAICGAEPVEKRPLHVDHDHDTGVVRGLLCVRCNNGLGQFGESPELLTRAKEYVAARPPGPLVELAVRRARELTGARG